MRKIQYLLINFLFMSFSLYALTLKVPEQFDRTQMWEWQIIEAEMISTPDKTITLIWAGGGGYVSMGLEFIDSMLEAQKQGKTVILDLQPGQIWSMHANVACYASKVKFEDGATLVFHPVINGNEIVHDPNALDYYQKLLQPCVTKGFLTQEDLKKALYYMEVYVKVCGSDKQNYCRSYRIDRRL